MRPVIGITTCNENRRNKKYSAVSQYYIRSILLDGGLPILLPVTQEQACLEAYINIIDGLLLTGGNEDVSPLLYNENPLQQITLISPERDRFEIALIKMAFDNQMPILGVCRGIQTLNVAMGGNLYQDTGLS